MGNILRTFKSSTMLSQKPVVTILGCTGTGKSKLAIELAKRFNGKIISADSMQVYKGLDIITNKVTAEEQKEAVHYCINCIDPLSRYTVVDFRNQALPVINNVMKQSKLPIIVGGTNYYIESLLWEVLIPNQYALVVWKCKEWGRQLTSPSSSYHSSKLRGLFKNSPHVASKWDVNITIDYLLKSFPATDVTDFSYALVVRKCKEWGRQLRSPSSSYHSSKLRGLFKNSPHVASKWDVNITIDYLLKSFPATDVTDFSYALVVRKCKEWGRQLRSPSSSYHSSKLRGLFKNSPHVASKWDVNITIDYLLKSFPATDVTDFSKEYNKLLFDEDSSFENYSHAIPSNVSSSTADLFKQKITADSFEDVSSIELHSCLKEIDPDMANSVHPEDRRKVIRSLQVYQQHGRRHSELLQEQRSQYGGSSLGGPLRFRNTIMLWLQCDKEVLNQRLDDRVDEMLERGLISELLNFHTDYNANRIDIQNPQYSEGIFQSIGFKEFHEYLILSEEEKNSDAGQRILEKAIEEMKLVTRQYARKQTKWIVNRFLKKPDRQLPPVYGLSATDLSMWNENVLQPAIDIVQSIIEDKVPSQKPLPVEEGLNDIKETYYCDVCERLILGQNVWKIHLNSKRHQKRKAKLKKLSEKSNEQKCANVS